MADHTSLLSPTKNRRFFDGFSAKNLSDSEAPVMISTPTSTLDTNNPSNIVNTFLQINTSSCNKIEPEAIGLALINDSIKEEKTDGSFSNPINRTILFGEKVKVQIPTSTPNSTSVLSPPNSPADFGIKTRNSKFSNPFSGTQVKGFTRQLSLKEMELSEDYTCVIIHGPNPKTTHIFDDCIVESCCNDDQKLCGEKEMECGLDQIDVSTSPSANLRSFCDTCKGNIEQGKDICICRD